MIQVIGIDDEPYALELMEAYCNQIPQVTWLEGFENPLEGIEFVNNNKVDLVLLDIQMPQLSGLDVVGLVHKDIPIVFTTAYDQYALEGYALRVFDYLLKPIAFERFAKTIEAIKKIKNTPNAGPSPGFIMVKTEHRIERVVLDELVLIKGLKDYLVLEASGKKIYVLSTFSKIMATLPNNFMRVHKSYIINLNKVEKFEKNKVQVGPSLVPIGASYKPDFLQRLGPVM